MTKTKQLPTGDPRELGFVPERLEQDDGSRGEGARRTWKGDARRSQR